MFKKIKDTFSLFSLSVWVVALGYFVDIFDLTLFGMVRIQSLKDIGIGLSDPTELVNTGIYLINAQSLGMIIGGLFWGILGDKKGRLNSLFASIFMYSIANILNSFVQTVDQYAILRFISGVGLAGELGIGITLISETLPKEKRGLGTALVATIGVFGATVAGVVVEYIPWRTVYLIGGSLGFALLFLRVKLQDSSMFQKTKETESGKLASWGSLKFLFSDKYRIQKFIACILIGVPIWFVAGIIMAFSPELGLALNVQGPITAAKAISISYIGLGIGDFLSGVISQILKSRKKVVILFKFFALVGLVALYFLSANNSPSIFYLCCFFIGIGAGYWAIFITIAAEQFGTNIRSTTATSIPNFVRGSIIPMALSFSFFKEKIGILQSAIVVGLIVYTISFIALSLLPETFAKDLDYLE